MKRVCVFAGSCSGRNPAYARAAVTIADALVRRSIGAIYGGGSVGMMGVLADAMLSRGGEVIGVIPEALEIREQRHVSLSELRVVSSMHERKAIMNELADGFVILPGGLGTMDELFEMWTWVQLGFIAKPIGVLNVQGYYDELFRFVEHMIAEGFVGERPRQMVIVSEEAGTLLDDMRLHDAPQVERWIDRDSV